MATVLCIVKKTEAKALRRDYGKWFGKVSAGARFACTQVWP
jgi:hypothetical protein